MGKTTTLPDGFGDHSPEWHFEKFVEFTRIKGEIGEPSPHLAIVGHLTQDYVVEERVWMMGCYGATYCLPSAQVIFDYWSADQVRQDSKEFGEWLDFHWDGIITRRERRCVRTPSKMAKCLTDYAFWQEEHFPHLTEIKAEDDYDYYDKVFKNVTDNVKYFGRYITIRVVEGLYRYAGVPAKLYDVRSVGGWSPKKAMMYLEPDHVEWLKQNTAEANAVMDELVEELIVKVQGEIPESTVDSYVVAAMLCEYKGAYENRHQYPGWTIDQEPLLYDKTMDYWGDKGVDKEALWEARAELFPHEVLGEITGDWYGTRWDVTGVLRDHGYNWNDLKFHYGKTKESGDFSSPVLRENVVEV